MEKKNPPYLQALRQAMKENGIYAVVSATLNPAATAVRVTLAFHERTLPTGTAVILLWHLCWTIPGPRSFRGTGYSGNGRGGPTPSTCRLARSATSPPEGRRRA